MTQFQVYVLRMFGGREVLRILSMRITREEVSLDPRLAEEIYWSLQ